MSTEEKTQEEAQEINIEEASEETTKSENVENTDENVTIETENTNDETSSTKRYMLGIFDKIFKAILLNLDNIEYLKYLIHYITKIPLNALKNIKVENALHPVSNKKDKEMESDIVVSIKNKIINIEMDKDYYDGVFQKSDAYLHRIEAKKYDEGENYKNGKQVIQIIFQNFDHFGKGEDIYEFRYYNKNRSGNRIK